VRKRNVVEIKATITGPESHIDSWVSDVESRRLASVAESTSSVAGRMYEERLAAKQAAEENASEIQDPGTD